MDLQTFFEDFLRTKLKLTPQQFNAVMADKKRKKTAYRILVTAPAGSGKTRVLASRYLKLLVDGERPQNIVAITFTRKAAGEMKERIVEYLLLLRDGLKENNIACKLKDMLNDEDSLNKLTLDMRISTIDSFLSNLIRLFPGESGVNPNFRVIDEIEEEELIDKVVDEVSLELLKQDSWIIRLLDFFNFNYSLSRKNQLNYLDSVKNIIINWEIYTDLIGDLSHKNQEQIVQNLRDYVGDTFELDKTLYALVQKVKELKEVFNDANSPYNDFIRFVTGTEITDLKTQESEFVSHKNIFFTKTFTPRKKPFQSGLDKTVKEIILKIGSLYEQYILAFAFRRDIKTSELTSNFVRLILGIVDKLRKLKGELGVIGMGDLKTISYDLLNVHRERFNILYNMDAKVNHYLIDEFQDTDPIQWRIFTELTRDWFSGEAVKQELNICPTMFLVGDEKQSIYGFRNADVRIINNLKKTEDSFTEKFQLLKNFRSKREIVTSVNQIFEKKMSIVDDRPFSVQYQKMEANDKNGGGTVKVFRLPIKGKKQDIPQLAREVTDLIISLKGRCKSWTDIALLFRNSLNFQFYEQALEKSSIPYISSGGKSFFENSEIRELLKIINFIENPYNDVIFSILFLSPLFNHSLSDLVRIIMNSETTIQDSDSYSLYDKLRINFKNEYSYFLNLTEQWITNRDRVPVDTLIESAIIETNAIGIFVDRRGGQKDANIRKFLTLATEIYEEKMNFGLFFEKLKRVIDAKQMNADADTTAPSTAGETNGAIPLLTVHKAKGLEFPIVILPEISMNDIKVKGDGVWIDRENNMLLFVKKYLKMPTPLSRKYEEKERAKQEEESKRLLYVALTRAMNELYLFLSNKDSNNKAIWLNIIQDSSIPVIPKMEAKMQKQEEMIIIPKNLNQIYNFTEKKKILRVEMEIAPSKIGKQVGRYDINREKAKMKGKIIHKLLELLAVHAIRHPSKEEIHLLVHNTANQIDEKFLSDGELLLDIGKHFSRVLENKDLMKIITDENSLNEFSFEVEKVNEQGEIQIIRGIVDKVILRDKKVNIYDYKTDAVHGMAKEKFVAETKIKYTKQMGEYRFAAKKLFAGRNVRMFLILTSILEIIEV